MIATKNLIQIQTFYLFIGILIYVLVRLKVIQIKRSELLHNYSFISRVLILATVLGFFLNLENNGLSGCFIHWEPIFRINNIIYSSYFLVLLIFASYAKNNGFKLSLHIFEFLCWLFHLFFLKGGYATGLGAIPDPFVASYDILVIFLRLLLIRNLLVRISSFYVFLIAIALITIKMVFFLPEKYQVFRGGTHDITPRGFEQTINGEWQGKCYYLDSVTIVESKNLFDFSDSLDLNISFTPEDTLVWLNTVAVNEIKVFIDSSLFIIDDGIKKSKYLLEMRYPDRGEIFSESKVDSPYFDPGRFKRDSLFFTVQNPHHILVLKHNDDSLRFVLWNKRDSFQFKLRTRNKEELKIGR